jgi:hypothetical protein
MERDPRRLGSSPQRRRGAPAVALAAALLAAAVTGAGMSSARAATPPGRTSPPPPRAAVPPPDRGRGILQWDHIEDSNDNTFDDFWGFLSYRQTHYQVWYGDFTKGGEVGGFLRDHRRSTYSAFYRYRKDFDQVLEIETEQILRKGFVLAALLRGIHVIPEGAGVERDQVLYGTGLDYYWSDYNFASFRAISDPRQGGRWSFITSVRLHHGASTYVQPGVVNRTDGSTGWFLNGKIRLFRWSVGKYNQFDWTDVDRTIYSAGLEWTY